MPRRGGRRGGRSRAGRRAGGIRRHGGFRRTGVRRYGGGRTHYSGGATKCSPQANKITFACLGMFFCLAVVVVVACIGPIYCSANCDYFCSYKYESAGDDVDTLFQCGKCEEITAFGECRAKEIDDGIALGVPLAICPVFGVIGIVLGCYALLQIAKSCNDGKPVFSFGRSAPTTTSNISAPIDPTNPASAAMGPPPPPAPSVDKDVKAEMDIELGPMGDITGDDNYQ